MNKKLQSEALQLFALEILKTNGFDASTIDITKEILHNEDLTKTLGVCKRTLFTYVKKGKIRCFTFGNRRLYLKSLFLEDILRQGNNPLQ